MRQSIIYCCTLATIILLLNACSKKQNITTTNSDGPAGYNYDFYWESDYPNAQSVVAFKTKNIPDGASLTWHVNKAVYETNNFKYTFPKGGKYNVKLVVNNDEAHSVTKEVVVVPVSAYIEYAGVRVTGDTIYFKSYRTDGGNHAWNFGDGSSSAQNDPYHIYTKAGNYTVRLTVTGLEDEPMTATTNIEIVDDPMHTAKMTTQRMWEITQIDFSMPANTTNAHTPRTDNFAIVYHNKIQVGFPVTGPVYGSISYNPKASTGNLLVFTRSHGISADTLIYDHIADTIYCKGTIWNVPPGAKSTDGTGSTYVMRSQ